MKYIKSIYFGRDNDIQHFSLPPNAILLGARSIFEGEDIVIKIDYIWDSENTHPGVVVELLIRKPGGNLPHGEWEHILSTSEGDYIFARRVDAQKQTEKESQETSVLKLDASKHTH
jgi:hypothetical protein